MKYKCPNRFAGEAAKGACFFEIEAAPIEGSVYINVGWSCVIVCDDVIPISWLSELIAIATAHPDKMAGFLKQYGCGGSGDRGNPVAGNSYALMCDPPT